LTVDSGQLIAPEVEFKIQNSKFKHVELTNVSAKNGRNSKSLIPLGFSLLSIFRFGRVIQQPVGCSHWML